MKWIKNLEFSKIAAKLLYGSLLLLAVLIITIDTPRKSSNEWQMHQNKEFGFTIQFPGDWSDDVFPTYRYPAYMQATLCSTCDINSLHINIYAVTNDGRFSNPTEWMKERVQSTDGFNLRRKSETTVGTKGYEASVWNFNEDVSFNIRTKSEVVLFVVEEVVYMVEFTAAEERLDNELTLFYEILSTFEITD